MNFIQKNREASTHIAFVACSVSSFALALLTLHASNIPVSTTFLIFVEYISLLSRLLLVQPHHYKDLAHFGVCVFSLIVCIAPQAAAGLCIYALGLMWMRSYDAVTWYRDTETL